MKKIIKRLLIIGSILLLIKLYAPPKWNGKFPDSMKESKRAGALVGEYRVNRVEILDSTVHVPVFKDLFKHIWVSKSCKVKRNALGIIYLEADRSSDSEIRFDILDKDTLFNKDNFKKNLLITDRGVFRRSIFDYNPQDTVYYTIYRMTKPFFKMRDEDLIPLFKMELVPISQVKSRTK
jgi:hypothetical protein